MSSINNLTPYIHYNRTTADAIALYERVLDAKKITVMRFGDVPSMNAMEESKNLVLHSVIQIGSSQVMASDAMPGQTISKEGNVQISMDFADLPGMEKAFNGLSEGGTVIMPLHDAFWGAKFGILTDAYGVRWLFNCNLQSAS